MKKYLFALLPLLPMVAVAQPKVKELTPKKLTSEIIYKGDLLQAITWQDNAGDNIVVLAETPQAQNVDRPEKGYFEASLEAHRYQMVNDHWKNIWTMNDQVNECNLLLNANFVEGTLEVTDLNNNGIGEVWLVYNVGCHRDRQPSFMKVIMYEGDSRYSMKGLPRGGSSKDAVTTTDYTLDDKFKQGPAAFREYGHQLWRDNATSGSTGKGKAYYKPRKFN